MSEYFMYIWFRRLTNIMLIIMVYEIYNKQQSADTFSQSLPAEHQRETDGINVQSFHVNSVCVLMS